MGAITGEWVDSGEKRDMRGRRVTPAERRLQMVAAYRAILAELLLRLPRSLLGKACEYLINHWEVPVAHQQHSVTRLDNNLVENAIRPSAIGKKNWLFVCHPEAGQCSAIIYSLVVSCQRHGKNPLAYIRDVLRRLPTMTTTDDLSSLTPSAWEASWLAAEW